MTGRNRLVAALAAGCLAIAGAAVPEPAAAASAEQPSQPKSGPGGSDYAHDGVRVSSGGTGADAWYSFEPIKPRPAKAPVAIVMHGYYEFSGYASMEALIRHTVRKGTTVIYPRWQTGVADPCPGPFLIQPCIDSAVAGINGALDHLRSGPRRVRPQVRKASYFGFSFGGIITANLANRWRELRIPKPRAVFLDDPHDGGLLTVDEPALDDDLSGIPSTTLFQCHSGAEGVLADTGPNGASKRDGSCNAVFPKLTSVPARNKDLVLTLPDTHGQPALSSRHGVCATGAQFGPPDAYDWNFCWKVWDALRSCALDGVDCEYALGNTREHRSHGRWDDGTAVKPLRIRNSAPIRP